MEQYPDKFTDNFEKNKEELGKLVKIESKKIRNMTAGYIVHLVRKKDKVLSPEIRQPKIEGRRRWRGRRRR